MGGLTLFLCGDVMTGRGIDQALAHPGDPTLQEQWIQDARDYVTLAEEENGPIARPLPPGDLWGDALEELERAAPDARIINLETSITRSDDFAPGKGIHYRMHPDNIACLTAGGVDVAVLANNHVLDFGRAGLRETLETLHAAGIRTAGAGRDAAEARRPAIVTIRGRSVAVLAVGTSWSGVPEDWAAGPDRPGVDLVPELTAEAAAALGDRVAALKRAGRLVIVSIHQGSNWGFTVPADQIRFAHHLIDRGADLVHGHSSHHARPIEVYRDRLVLYGCGDFINDYEGISGYEQYRGDLALMYFARLRSESGALESLRLVPLRRRRFRLARAAPEDSAWLRETLKAISRDFGLECEPAPDGSLAVQGGASLRP